MTTGAGETLGGVLAIYDDPHVIVEAAKAVPEAVENFDEIIEALPAAIEDQQQFNNPHDPGDQYYDDFRYGWYQGYFFWFVVELAVPAGEAGKALKSTDSPAESPVALSLNFVLSSTKLVRRIRTRYFATRATTSCCVMSMSTQETADEESETTPARRALLGAVGAATGLTALTGTGTAQGDGTVQTRGCSDAELTPDDWSTGAITVQDCSGTGGQIDVSVTGSVSEQRYVSSTAPLPSSGTLTVPAGGRETLWFTGRLSRLSCSNDALNVGVVNRG
ncbi:hypothetical protein DV706_07580 [Natronorubrum bangense]|nr:hypothetical protein DV706_07580 [Natronorubrum bangense]